MELLKLLETQSNKKSVGTLTLNKNKRFREIFFEEDSIYLVGEIYSGKIAVTEALLHLVKTDRVSIEEIQTIPSKVDLSEHTVPEILFQRGTIEEDAFFGLLTAQLLEEIIDLFFHNDLSFHFQEGRVPENLLDAESLVASTPIHIADVLDELRRRNSLLQKSEQLVPSVDEVFVVTEIGMSYKQGRPCDIVLQQTFDLMDGFRDLKSIVHDSDFFEFDILSLVVEALEHGHLKKTLHPELKGISTNNLSPADAETYLPFYKNAVKYGVDEIAARERLAAVYEKLHKVDDAVIQYNFIGDALFRMNKASKAVRAYQRALSLKPGEPLLTDKIWKIYLQAANEELEQDRTDAAIPLLQAALRIRPNDRTVFEPLAEALLTKERFKEIGDLLDFLRAEAKKSGDCEAAIHAFGVINEALPKHAGFHRKSINLYLDFDLVEEARQAMTQLAELYEQQGARVKARELREKVERLTSGGVARKKRENSTRKPRKFRKPQVKSAVALRCFFGFILVFFFYQACSLVVWYNVKAKHRIVLALGMDQPPERMDFREKSYEGRNQNFASDCKRFLDRFPGSLLLPEAREFYLEARTRTAELRARRGVLKQQRLNDARRLLEVEGDPDGALAIVDEVGELNNEPSISEAIEELRTKISASTQPTARDLKKEGDGLVEQGRWKAAYDRFRELLVLYPNSRSARKVTLPVVVESRPPGAQVLRSTALLGQKDLGSTPFQTRLSPGDSKVFTLSLDGFYDREVEILEPERGEPGVEHGPFVLDRQPGWSRTLSASLAAAPTLTEGVLFLGTEDGDMLWFQPKGEVEGKLKAPGGDFQTLKFKPNLSERQAYVVWTNGSVGHLVGPTKRDRISTLRLAKEYTLPKLATTPIHLIAQSGTLVIGTKLGNKEGQLFGWSTKNPGGVSSGWQIPLNAEATTLARYDWPESGSKEDLLVGTERGRVLRLTRNVEPGKPPITRWEVSVSTHPIVELMRTGERIAVRTAKTGELILLDGETGARRANPTLFGNLSVAFLPQKESIYTLAENGDLAVLRDGETDFTLTSGADEERDDRAVRIVPLWNALGVLQAKRVGRSDAPLRLLVFDVSSPTKPRLLWATRTTDPIRTAVSDGEWVAVISQTTGSKPETRVQVHSIH